MTAIPLLEALIAAGTPAPLIAQVAQLAAEVASVRKRRAADAARQRESRHRRHVTSVTSQDVTGHHPPAYTTPPEESSEPKRVLRSRKTILSDDWQPDLEYARSRGWSQDYALSEAQRFRDHAKAGARKCADWQAAWRNWVTSPYQQTPKHGAGNGAGNPLMAAFDKLIARAEEAEGDGDPPIRDITPTGDQGG